MDIILQSWEDVEDCSERDIQKLIEAQLKENFVIHEYQVWYWSAFDSYTSDGFKISPILRQIWYELNSDKL